MLCYSFRYSLFLFLVSFPFPPVSYVSAWLYSISFPLSHPPRAELAEGGGEDSFFDFFFPVLFLFHVSHLVGSHSLSSLFRKRNWRWRVSFVNFFKKRIVLFLFPVLMLLTPFLIPFSYLFFRPGWIAMSIICFVPLIDCMVCWRGRDIVGEVFFRHSRPHSHHPRPHSNPYILPLILSLILPRILPLILLLKLHLFLILPSSPPHIIMFSCSSPALLRCSSFE